MGHETHEEKELQRAQELAKEQALAAERASDTDDDFVDSNETLEAEEEKY